MVLDVTVNRVFIPEWNNNKLEIQKVEVGHKAPTVALFNKLIPKPVYKMSVDKDGNGAGGESEVVLDYSKIVKEMVTDIQNLSYKVDGKEVKIEKAMDLFGDVPPALSGLIDEIGLYLSSLLQTKVVDPKN